MAGRAAPAANGETRGDLMPRPRKWRKVCSLPQSDRYGPLNARQDAEPIVVMTVDEYETIRLIDLEGFTQEECAEQMNIARTTVQRIYELARGKLAESLVRGRVLHIEGGEYRLCEGLEKTCRCGGCPKHRCTREAETEQGCGHEQTRGREYGQECGHRCEHERGYGHGYEQN